MTAAGLVGCGAAPPARLVGVSDAVPEPPGNPVLPTPTRAVWPELEAARAWPEAAPAFLALSHRRDGSLVHVRVDPAALSAYLSLAVDAPMPEGARVIAWHEAPSGQVLDGYLLEKRAGAWSAAVIDARGALLRGPHASCLRCHDMAPTDHLFGRRAPQPASTHTESFGAERR
ncbi:MAG: hypothetical protein K0R38_5598 [Polyangiaceae bacterium]|jgi:hypothetical protein|nr:hypothetical protein [Polyangiaceae bacterium]